ncbi:MAG TPA: DUF1036 domain-containing protein [Candidatus Baltobacteraceae bacterium]|nr:DUF1036 domain-containing protein [Candidatus Baltobacteraceae bacterium]
MRLGLFAAALLFFGVALAGTAKAELVVCNHTGQTIWVAYIMAEHHAYSGHGWWKEADGECRTLSSADVNGVAYVTAQSSQAETIWPASGGDSAIHGCIRAESFDYDRPDDAECPDGFIWRDFALASDPLETLLSTSVTYTFEPLATPTPSPPPATPTPAAASPHDLAFNRARELFDRGRYAESIGFFTQAAHLGGDAASYYYRAQAKFDLGQFEAALKDADEGVRISSAGGAAGAGHVFQAEAEWALGLFDSAAGDYMEGAKDAKGWNNFWIASAVLVMRAGGHQNQAAHLLQACKKHCARDVSRVLTEYLAGTESATALLRHIDGATTAQEINGLIGYDLYLRKQRKAAAPFLKKALTGTRALAYIVPTPILRAALNDRR